MTGFVKLNLYDAELKGFNERWFNVNSIRHIEPDTNKVMLNGARVPIVVSKDCMENLMDLLSKEEAIRMLPFSIDNHLREISASESSSLSAKVAVLNQALINFSAMLRGEKERVALLMQTDDETDALINMVYKDITKALGGDKEESESAEVAERKSFWSRIVGFFKRKK